MTGARYALAAWVLASLALPCAGLLQAQTGNPQSWFEYVRRVGRDLSRGDEDQAAEMVGVLVEVLARLEEVQPRTKDVCSAFVYAASLLGGQPVERLPEGFEPEGAVRAGVTFVVPFGDPEIEGYAHVKLAELLLRARRLEDAEAALREGIERCARARPRLVELELLLAQVVRERGALTEAWGLVQRAEDVFYGGGGHVGIPPEFSLYERYEGMLLGVRGETLLLLGNPDQAAPDLRREMELARRSRSATALRRAFRHAVDLAFATGRTARVEALVDEALGDLRLGERDPGFAVSLAIRVGAARSQAARSDPSLAESAERVLSGVMQDPWARPFDRLRAGIFLADLLLRSGRIDEAAAELAMARARAAETSADDDGGSPAPERELMLVALEARLAMLRARAAGEAAEPGEPTEPASDLRERLTALEAAFEAWLARWDDAPRLAGGVGFLHHPVRRLVLSELLALTRIVHPGEEGVARALEHVVRAQARGSLARRERYRPRPLSELRAQLSEDDAGLLVYVPGPDRTDLFALDRGRLRHAELASLPELEPARADVEALVSTPPDASARKRGRRVLFESPAARGLATDLLPERVRALLREWRAVTVVGVELLGYVPFELLPLDAERLLGDGLAVGYLPSLPVGALLVERAGTAVEAEHPFALLAATGIADAVAMDHPDLEPLPFEARQRELLTGAYRDPRVIRGPAATRAVLAGEAVRGAAVLHLLAHGVHDARSGPGLCLAPEDERDDGIVWAADVLELSVPRHVVVTACGAARGPLRRGEDGVTSFAGALLAAGALSVVLSPNVLDYGAVLLLSGAYHRHLAGGATPAEALGRAREELPERWAHPFYSTLHVVGLAHEPVFRR